MKKTLLVILIFLPLFLFTGCSNDKDTPNPDVEETDNDEDDDTEEDDDDDDSEEVEAVDPSTIEPQEPATINSSYTTETVVSGLDIPWGMVFLPDGSMLITELDGELIHFKDGVKTTVQDTPEVYNNGQGGLLDLELHPNYVENGWLYLSYASSEGEGSGGHTAIMRARLQEDPLALIDKEVLYKGSPNSTSGNHFGSRIDFDDQGYLYFTIGDRGDYSNNPQDITRDGGKVYRLNDDGTIPGDNPFVGVNNAKEAIYSYGHRNPQGMLRHPETGEIWANEHGPQGGDEINIIENGLNYGWPVISYGIDYNDSNITDITAMEGMEQPIHYWVPSIAPSGMTFVSSDNYPDLNGNLLVGSLVMRYLERLVLDGNNNVTSRENLLNNIGRVRNVVQGPDGYIYIAVEGNGILRLVEQ